MTSRINKPLSFVVIVAGWILNLYGKFGEFTYPTNAIIGTVGLSIVLIGILWYCMVRKAERKKLSFTDQLH